MQEWIASQTTIVSGIVTEDDVGRVIELEDTESRKSLETVYQDASDGLESGSPAQKASGTSEDDVLQASSINEREDMSQNDESGVTPFWKAPPGSQILKTPANDSAQTSIKGLESTRMGEDISPIRSRRSLAWRRRNKAQKVIDDEKVAFAATFEEYVSTSRLPRDGHRRRKVLKSFRLTHENAKTYQPEVHRDSSGTHRIKFVVIGDGAVGKTVLLM